MSGTYGGHKPQKTNRAGVGTTESPRFDLSDGPEKGAPEDWRGPTWEGTEPMHAEQITARIMPILEEHARDFLLVVEDLERNVHVSRSSEINGQALARHADNWIQARMDRHAAKRVDAELKSE